MNDIFEDINLTVELENNGEPAFFRRVSQRESQRKKKPETKMCRKQTHTEQIVNGLKFSCGMSVC